MKPFNLDAVMLVQETEAKRQMLDVYFNFRRDTPNG